MGYCLAFHSVISGRFRLIFVSLSDCVVKLIQQPLWPQDHSAI